MQDNSVISQKEMIEHYSKMNGIEVDDYFVDFGISGGSTIKREKYLELQELIKQGNVLNPANLENYSVLLREESEGQTDTMLQEQENMINQEETAIRQAQAQQVQGPPQEGPEQPAPGGMPEDPTQAGPAQERLQGGPTADQIRKREFAENAPQ